MGDQVLILEEWEIIRRGKTGARYDNGAGSSICCTFTTVLYWSPWFCKMNIYQKMKKRKERRSWRKKGERKGGREERKRERERGRKGKGGKRGGREGKLNLVTVESKESGKVAEDSDSVSKNNLFNIWSCSFKLTLWSTTFLPLHYFSTKEAICLL